MSSRSRRARDRLAEPVGGAKPVAVAVCFRRRDRRLQFRLVRSGDGARWTFPGGSLRLAETPTRAAAREASEKAGVIGVIVEQPLAEFRHGRRSDDVATAFLLAVQSTAPSGAEGRNPTWFDLEATRERLSEGRAPDEAAELQRVIDVAAERLRER